MHTSLMAIILVSIVIPASDAAPSISENYRVSEILRVLSPNSFESKLENYKPAKFVRFRVILRGFESGDSDKASKEYLENILKSANRIELRNAKLRSYFRVEADLWLDGKPFGDKHASAVAESDKETVKDSPNPIIYRPGTPLVGRKSEPSAKRSLPAKRHSSTIAELMDTQIDCSMLTEDMPLSEALDLLSESVQPCLPLLIHWEDLQVNALIEKDTPIGVEGFARLKLSQALDAILRSAAGREPNPALVAEGGILILASQQMLQKYRTTRVYDVRDLLAVPSTLGGYMQGSYGNSGGNFSR